MKYFNHQGYRIIYDPENPLVGQNGCISEHRLIMTKKLGRALLSDELIHHINGNKQDNKEENLQLLYRERHNKIHGKWSQDELIILKDNYYTKTKEMLLQLLPKKEWDAIQQKAQRMKIKRIRQDHNRRKGLSIKQLATIYLQYPSHSKRELLILFPDLKYHTIKQAARRLGACTS